MLRRSVLFVLSEHNGQIETQGKMGTMEHFDHLRRHFSLLVCGLCLIACLALVGCQNGIQLQVVMTATGEDRLIATTYDTRQAETNGYFRGKYEDCVTDRLRKSVSKSQWWVVGTYQPDDAIMAECDDMVYGWVRKAGNYDNHYYSGFYENENGQNFENSN